MVEWLGDLFESDEFDLENVKAFLSEVIKDKREKKKKK